MIMELLLLLVPGVAGVALYRLLEKQRKHIYDYVEYYAFFTFFAYFMNSNVMYLRGWQDFSLQEIGLTAQIKYGILSVAFVVLLAVLLHFGKAWKNIPKRFKQAL